MIMSGLPEVDIDDLRSNTEYGGYTSSSPQIQWFWRAVRSFNRELRLKLVQFATGTGRIPSGGFSLLVGMRFAPHVLLLRPHSRVCAADRRSSTFIATVAVRIVCRRRTLGWGGPCDSAALIVCICSFNQIDLPEYESYEQLRKNLLLAITEGAEGFGFA